VVANAYFVPKILAMLQLNQQAPVSAPEPAYHGRGQEMQHSSQLSTRDPVGWASMPGWQQNTSMEA